MKDKLPVYITLENLSQYFHWTLIRELNGTYSLFLHDGTKSLSLFSSSLQSLVEATHAWAIQSSDFPLPWSPASAPEAKDVSLLYFKVISSKDLKVYEFYSSPFQEQALLLNNMHAVFLQVAPEWWYLSTHPHFRSIPRNYEWYKKISGDSEANAFLLEFHKYNSAMGLRLVAYPEFKPETQIWTFIIDGAKEIDLAPIKSMERDRVKVAFKGLRI